MIHCDLAPLVGVTLKNTCWIIFELTETRTVVLMKLVVLVSLKIISTTYSLSLTGGFMP